MTKQAGIGTLEWIIVALIILIIGGTVVYSERESARKARYMESVSGELIDALDRHRAANKSYPDTLEKLVPTYMQELPGCLPQAYKPIYYYVDKTSGEYFLICGVGLLAKRRYSSQTKAWDMWTDLPG